MTYLLDTHVWIWGLAAPDRLSTAARRALDRASAQDLALSPISVWETVLLGEKGRLVLDPDPVTWARRALEVAPATMAPLTQEIALRSRSLPGFPSEDPADRFLAATCLEHDLTLVTADRALRGYGPVRTLW